MAIRENSHLFFFKALRDPPYRLIGPSHHDE